jgi:hypothetical protein
LILRTLPIVMHKPTAEPVNGQAYIELRRGHILEALGRRPRQLSDAMLSPARMAFLRREAEALYWNELAWEELTDDEIVHGGHLTEMVFPGLLAFVDGLVSEGNSRPPHLEVVESILAFLGDRYATLSAELEAGADSRKLVWARAMTARLVDLVLYRLLGLSAAEREELEAAS